jgi:PAS domain S-box-containing protein
MVNQEQKIKILLEDMEMLESYTEDLFSFAPLSLCFINPAGMVLELNPAFESMTGYSQNEAVGEKLSLFVNEEYLKEFLNKLIEKEAVNGEEILIKNKEGEDIPVLIFAKIRRAEDKEINGIFISFFDLTEIKKKEAEIQRNKKELEEKIREMEKFNQLVVGRELKMAELKEKIKELEERIKEIEG